MKVAKASWRVTGCVKRDPWVCSSQHTSCFAEGALRNASLVLPSIGKAFFYDSSNSWAKASAGTLASPLPCFWPGAEQPGAVLPCVEQSTSHTCGCAPGPSCVYGPVKVVSGQLHLWCGRPSYCSQPHSGYNNEVHGE